MLSPMTSQRPDSCQIFGGIEGREQQLLGADGVHFFSHDLLDFEQRTLREIEVTVDAGGELADVARAQQEAMAGDLRIDGVFAQRGDEELAPEHSFKGSLALCLRLRSNTDGHRFEATKPGLDGSLLGLARSSGML
jgi:hypothetical protein